jgi:hypothetical protein
MSRTVLTVLKVLIGGITLKSIENHSLCHII